MLRGQASVRTFFDSSLRGNWWSFDVLMDFIKGTSAFKVQDDRRSSIKTARQAGVDPKPTYAPLESGHSNRSRLTREA